VTTSWHTTADHHFQAQYDRRPRQQSLYGGVCGRRMLAGSVINITFNAQVSGDIQPQSVSQLPFCDMCALLLSRGIEDSMESYAFVSHIGPFMHPPYTELWTEEYGQPESRLLRLSFDLQGTKSTTSRFPSQNLKWLQSPSFSAVTAPQRGT
jgi:hypothetical protein